MSDLRTIDRRSLLRILGLGAVAAGSGSLAVLGKRAVSGSPADSLSSAGLKAPSAGAAVPSLPVWDHAQSDEAGLLGLVAPLRSGDRVGYSTFETLEIASSGALFAFFTAEDGGHFRIDVCARDEAHGAPSPVAQTDGFDLFLANDGYGDKATAREHGLAAYGLADALRLHEGSSKIELLTMSDRWSRFSKAELGPRLA